MEETGLPQEETFEPKEYLTQQQIEAAKGRILTSAALPDTMACITMIDGYVRLNQTADAEYETLFNCIQNAMNALGDQMRYIKEIKDTLPVLFFLLYYDYLILTGVMSQEDLNDMRDAAMKAMMNGGPAQA